MKKSPTIELSREHTQMLIDLRQLLRPHGVTISLTDRHAALQLINASSEIEDDTIQQIRSRLITLLPETQYCDMYGEPNEQVKCDQCQSIFQLEMTRPSEKYIACSCGNLLLCVVKDLRSRPRQSVNLPGLYRSEGGTSRIGEMIVEDLSYDGARIRCLTPHNISQNDRLVISFMLDDASQSSVHKTVSVRHVKEDMMGVKFIESSDLDHHLASYLGINWIKL